MVMNGLKGLGLQHNMKKEGQYMTVCDRMFFTVRFFLRKSFKPIRKVQICLSAGMGSFCCVFVDSLFCLFVFAYLVHIYYAKLLMHLNFTNAISHI